MFYGTIYLISILIKTDIVEIAVYIQQVKLHKNAFANNCKGVFNV